MPRTQFEQQLYDMIRSQNGIYHPVKASLSERLLTKEVSLDKLHPNPDDAFSMEEVGPSMRIISEYTKQFREAIDKNQSPVEEPIIVKKLRPDGYMILNGHHRWAAAMKVG